MRHDVVIFLGPSLERELAEAEFPACILPPAKRGDVTGAVASGARIITLIDGVFFQDDAVGHREILDAIAQGVRVIGSSSMGALRAAELDVLGMEGVGTVYALYRDGVLVSDDEVALVFDPATGTALSEPLVNIRCTLKKAVGEKVITPEAASVVLDAAAALYFPDRSWEEILETAELRLPAAVIRDLSAFVRSSAVDQKRDDALAALRRTREIAIELGLMNG
ncbi:MAG: TfuA-related McrA-glycine thioamidation protein [Methanoregulaceae archaeon]|nr:TfuA-related McrA-glycine thioamidation protein [Methanoregulaceae archaeon]